MVHVHFKLFKTGDTRAFTNHLLWDQGLLFVEVFSQDPSAQTSATTGLLQFPLGLFKEDWKF